VAALEAAMSGDPNLEHLRRAYTRLSYDVGGRINFACDLDSDVALAIAEQEKAHLDQAFFVLSFAALEQQITLLASLRLAEAERRAAMREAAFQQRWQTAIRVAEETLAADVHWRTEEQTILSWYKIRSDIAHGQPATQLADVPSVIYRADDVATTLNRVTQLRMPPPATNPK
jgi:hypothetical protein